MRPGQAAPEFYAPAAVEGDVSDCFNEAGAGCPGILREWHRPHGFLKLLQ